MFLPHKCCEEFMEAFDEDLLTMQDCAPFDSRTLLPLTVFLISDGGHGGMKPAKFCPFCGQEISFEAVTCGDS